MIKRIVGVVALLTGIGAAFGQTGLMQGIGGGGAAGSQVKAEAMLDVAGIGAGRTFTLAVVLTTTPEHHIYWTNPGESGLPTTFKFELPAGFKAQALAYPVPMKFVQPGNIAGYGYTGKAIFLFTVMAPVELKGGDAVGPIKVTASWLCCDKEQCVPGSAKLEVPLTVIGGSTGIPPNRLIFAAARAALPEKNPPEVKLLETSLATVREGGPVMQSLGWNITWVGERPPQGIEFFPADLEGLKVDRIDVGTMPVSTGGAVTRVTVRSHVMQGQQLGGDRFTGVVAFTRADGTRTGFLTSADVRSLAETQPAATKP